VKFRVLVSTDRRFYRKILKLVRMDRRLSVDHLAKPTDVLKLTQFEIPNIFICEADKDKGTQELDSLIIGLRERHPDLSIIAVSANPNWRSAVHLLKLGASEYFILPDEYHKVCEAIERGFGSWISQQEEEDLSDFEKQRYDFGNILGKSPQLLDVLQKAQSVIDSDEVTVLILGETGTGKELLAKAIHYNSVRKKDPFLEIACTAIPETLLESELFGYEKGAFTDATDSKKGLLEVADGGTVFLDEIGDISLNLQSKLLKVIEEKKFRRLGGVDDISVDVRIITATNKNLEAAVAAGTFRRDLYFRLNGMQLRLPPLRERGDDVLQIADALVRQFNQLHNKNIQGISPEAQSLLLDHRWEGNVRELKHAIERAVMLAEENILRPVDFDFLTKPHVEADTDTAVSSAAGKRPEEEKIILEIPLRSLSVREVERLCVQKVLELTAGNKTRAAKMLHISRPKLDRLIRRYALSGGSKGGSMQ
jgi:two-component system response regulator AtoC